MLRADTDDPRVVIVELCKLFYTLGWAQGTGGGVSVKHKGRVYMAPSGVQKEMIDPRDIFVLSEDGATVLEGPRLTRNLKLSECAPLFCNAFTLRAAGACLHSHSTWAVLATVLDETSREFACTQLEMMKGIPGVGFYDVLRVPIVENTARECELTERMAAAMQQYPSTYAVLVRRHGVYVWGESWQKAKSIAECYDYLFRAAVEMKRMGIDARQAPKNNLSTITTSKI